MTISRLTAFTVTRNSRNFVRTMQSNIKRGVEVSASDMKNYEAMKDSAKISNNIFKNIRNFWKEFADLRKGI